MAKTAEQVVIERPRDERPRLPFGWPPGCPVSMAESAWPWQ